MYELEFQQLTIKTFKYLIMRQYLYFTVLAGIIVRLLEPILEPIIELTISQIKEVIEWLKKIKKRNY